MKRINEHIEEAVGKSKGANKKRRDNKRRAGRCYQPADSKIENDKRSKKKCSKKKHHRIQMS